MITMVPVPDRLQPNPMDVLLGRGKSFRKNPGNILFAGNEYRWSKTYKLHSHRNTGTILNL